MPQVAVTYTNCGLDAIVLNAEGEHEGKLRKRTVCITLQMRSVQKSRSGYRMHKCFSHLRKILFSIATPPS